MEQAASTLWQGFTAHAFACSSYPIKAGDKVLVHAAAGGVGSLITQIAKNTGTGCLRSDCSKLFRATNIFVKIKVNMINGKSNQITSSSSFVFYFPH